MKQINYKKLILPNIPYVFFVYLFDKVGQAVRLAPGADISAKILNITQGFSAAFENALPSVYPLDLLVGIVGAVIIRLIVYVKGKNAKKYRKGAEYGSARWGNAEDIKPYIDPDFQNNIILTQTERLTMNSRPKQPKYARNKNVVVIGGSGSGKTRFFVKPNLMQLHSSYVLTDPKGTVLIECGKLLQRAGYRIKVLNTINFKKSMHYNPFVYIRSEKDILKLVNTLIANTKGEGEKSAEDFWVKAERLLYCALVGYIWYEAPAEEMNFITLLELINASEAREDDEEYQSPVDLLFADLEERDPDHFAVKQYRKYKLAAGKTAKSILISCGARLAPFDIKELRDLMSYDELELDTLGDRKTALFLIMSDTDSTFNFVIAMLQSQLFNLLCDKADDEYGGKLPGQGDAPANGLHCLGAGHGGAFGKVRSPGGNAAVPHAGHRRTGYAHVHRQHIAVRRLRHPADAGAPRGKVLGYGAGHALVGLAYALRHHAVVCAEHRHHPAGKIKLCLAGQRSGVLQQRFQRPQPAQGLGKACPVGMGGSTGSVVRRGDGSKQLHQFSFGHFRHPLCFKKCCAACTKRRGRAVPAQ